MQRRNMMNWFNSKIIVFKVKSLKFQNNIVSGTLIKKYVN